ncbi:MAG: xanthine dehydrogenase family protein molybdopterin-binding subunit [Desulfobacterales bacterium]|nr:xanthine dehydrogenase family protein molybdopterin-binding subunit [Desulfobacterales bacterium]
MDYKLVGKDFTPPDVIAKVTGRAKFAEDFRAEGMLFLKLFLSPMPHARVRSIDASAALKMKGVVAVMTADDLPKVAPPANTMLTNEPVYYGEPILAVAAIDETTAADAVEKIKVDLQPLPFVVDPLESLYPGGPDARTDGNVANSDSVKLQTVKWKAQDFAAAGEGRLPMGKPAGEWSYGDLEAGFAAAKVVLDESFVTASYSHQSQEPRSAMAYWQNGKCYVHASCQSGTNAVPGLAKFIGIKPSELVFIAENCGGGFGSKGNAYPLMALPAHVSKKTGRPVMMRISRAEEYYVGSGRAGYQGRVKVGFRADGRISALDMYIVQDNGPNSGFRDYENAGSCVSILYQPLAMRWRGIPVLTNTPPKGPQRGPGENQMASAMEPILDKAAKQLGLDRVAIRRINAPDSSGKIWDYRRKNLGPLTSAFQKEALDKGAQVFNWQEKKKLSGQRKGAKVMGVGVGQSYHGGGNSGFDGLVRILPDGKLHIHNGVGNLGTYSYAGTARVAAEVLNYQWENCVIEYGNTSRHLPWNLGQFGSLTAFTESRTNFVAATDAKIKLLEIAARDLGGAPEDYQLAEERVVSKSDPSKSLTYAKAAQRAIELGGKYSGKELPEDINPITRHAAAALAGSGLIGVSKDYIKRTAAVPSLVCAFAQIELDLETGKFEILDLTGVADCGTVLHPQSYHHQMNGGAVWGIGMAALERWVYDTQFGRPANRGFHQQKPPSWLDVPLNMKVDAVNIPDPQNPVGVRGMGEPIMGGAAAALLCAISDALGGHLFYRQPVLPDMILNAAAGKPQSHKPLKVNTQ